MTMQSDSRFTDRALMGRVWWWLVIGPLVRLTELQGWWIDRQNEKAWAGPDPKDFPGSECKQ